MPEETIKIVADLIRLANETDTEYIDDHSDLQIIVHCAEEMAECSSALSKVAREMLGGPRLSITEDKAKEHMMEELADAMSLGYMLIRKLGCEVDIAEIHLKKSKNFDNTRVNV